MLTHSLPTHLLKDGNGERECESGAAREAQRLEAPAGGQRATGTVGAEVGRRGRRSIESGHSANTAPRGASSNAGPVNIYMEGI